MVCISIDENISLVYAQYTKLLYMPIRAVKTEIILIKLDEIPLDKEGLWKIIH